MDHLILSVGELLWDILPDRTILGGAPSNLAYRLVEMGNDCRIVTRIGTDELGDRALELVSSLGLSTEFIQRDGNYGTGTVDVTFDESRNPDYIINTHAAYDFIEATPGLLEAASHCRCLVFGILAQRTPVTRETIAMLMEHSQVATKFLDINLRKDCYSDRVVDASLRNADVLKANFEEILEIRKMTGMNEPELPGLMQSMAAMYKIGTIVVTMEEFGAMLYDREQGTHYLPGYRVDLEDPLGAGDAFSAAFIHHLLRGSSLTHACIRGNQLGAAAATTRGATHSLNAKYIQSIIREDQMNIYEKFREYIPEDGSN